VTEYAVYTDSGASTYKCAAGVKSLRSQRNDTAVKLRSSSTSDLPKKTVSLEMAFILPPVFDNDKYEALGVQLETVRLYDICITDPIKSLLD
jgi:hypothetical protein